MANTKTLYDLLEDIKLYTDALYVEIRSQVADLEWEFSITDDIPSSLLTKTVKRYSPMGWVDGKPMKYLITLDDKEDFRIDGKVLL